MDIKGEICQWTDHNTVTVRDFNIPLASLDRCSQEKNNKETAALNGTLDQMDLIDIFRAFHPKGAEYAFFSRAEGTVSKIHTLGHKTHLNKFKKIEIISSIFSDYNVMKLETNHKKNTEKHADMEAK